MPDAHELLDAYAQGDPPEALAALRAVLDLHAPIEVIEGGLCCRHCFDQEGDMAAWPCPTEQAITKALEAK